MLKKSCCLLLFLLVLPACSVREEQRLSESDLLHSESDQKKSSELKPDEDQKPDVREDRSFLVGLLLYIPNRIFDVLDIVKAKVRVGPGVSVGAQLTKPISVYVGAHTDVYIGLPGPRLERIPPIPVGAEAVAGASLSVLDATVNSDTTRDKGTSQNSNTEISAELHLILVGVEIGIDPIEIFDALGGLVFIDFREDDL